MQDQQNNRRDHRSRAAADPGYRETDDHAPPAVLPELCRRRPENGALPRNPGSDPLKKYFAGRPGQLLEAGLKLGGVREKYGDVSVTLYAFPKISLTYIFWDKDEEFPPSANILFQDTIAQWTHPESVPTLAQIGTERLIQEAV